MLLTNYHTNTHRKTHLRGGLGLREHAARGKGSEHVGHQGGAAACLVVDEALRRHRRLPALLYRSLPINRCSVYRCTMTSTVRTKLFVPCVHVFMKRRGLFMGVPNPSNMPLGQKKMGSFHFPGSAMESFYGTSVSILKESDRATFQRAPWA